MRLLGPGRGGRLRRLGPPGRRGGAGPQGLGGSQPVRAPHGRAGPVARLPGPHAPLPGAAGAAVRRRPGGQRAPPGGRRQQARLPRLPGPAHARGRPVLCQSRRCSGRGVPALLRRPSRVWIVRRWVGRFRRRRCTRRNANRDAPGAGAARSRRREARHRRKAGVHVRRRCRRRSRSGGGGRSADPSRRELRVQTGGAPPSRGDHGGRSRRRPVCVLECHQTTAGERLARGSDAFRWRRPVRGRHSLDQLRVEHRTRCSDRPGTSHWPRRWSRSELARRLPLCEWRGRHARPLVGARRAARRPQSVQGAGHTGRCDVRVERIRHRHYRTSTLAVGARIG